MTGYHQAPDPDFQRQLGQQEGEEMPRERAYYRRTSHTERTEQAHILSPLTRSRNVGDASATNSNHGGASSSLHHSHDEK
jgi:hypothetical protein